MNKKHYTARWLSPSLTQLGNVSFDANNDTDAIKQAERIGKEINLPRSSRTIHEGGRLVHQRGYQFEE